MDKCYTVCMVFSHVPVYNLKVVRKETGISADVLRAWERRYGLPSPQRSPGGHRLYSQYDIELIRWLMARIEEGLSISRAVDLWKEYEAQNQEPLSASIPRRVTAPSEPVSLPGLFPADLGLDTMRAQWISACLAFNESVAEQVLNQAFAVYPVDTVCSDILQAGLNDIGERWYYGKADVPQEHFASSLAIRRLDALIAAAPAPTRMQTVLVACPPGERHVFSSLVISLFLRRRGLNVVYLGADVPLARFDSIVRQIHPHLVVLSAQRLHTAYTLLEMASSLFETGVTVGYGGRIFNHAPHIQVCIPAFFLGRDVVVAIQSVEQLLSSPEKSVVGQHSPCSKQFEHARQEFQQHLHQIQQSMLETFDIGMPVEYVSAANLFMEETLTAALALGDLSLIESEIDWVRAYLGRMDLDPQHVSVYLGRYAEAVDQKLGSNGEPIVGLINSLLEKMETQ